MWSPKKCNNHGNGASKAKHKAKKIRKTVFDPFVAEGEVTTGTTYEVLANAEVREVLGWSCKVIVSE